MKTDTDTEILEIIRRRYTTENGKLYSRRTGREIEYYDVKINYQPYRVEIIIFALAYGVLDRNRPYALHLNGDPYDHRPENLRLSDKPEVGRKMYANGSSGYLGVYRDKNAINATKIWQAITKLGDKLTRLGNYETPEEAARAVDAARVEYYGSRVTTNASRGLI